MRIVVWLLSLAGMLHFGLSLLNGGMFYIRNPLAIGFTTDYVLWRAGSFLWPYVVLLVVFMAAPIVAAKWRRLGAAMLGLALAISVAMCTYDLRHERFRVTTETPTGPDHRNVIWWWWRR